VADENRLNSPSFFKRRQGLKREFIVSNTDDVLSTDPILPVSSST
jgi:hypothetical protein